MLKVESVRSEFISDMENAVVEAMSWCPTSLGYVEDVVGVLVDLLPSVDTYTPDHFGGDESTGVIEWIEMAASGLDLDGHVAREALEELFDGLIHFYECEEFYREYEAECDEAVFDMGGLSEVVSSTDCETVSDVVYRVANLGADRMWRGYMSDVLDGVRVLLEKMAEEYGATV